MAEGLTSGFGDVGGVSLSNVEEFGMQLQSLLKIPPTGRVGPLQQQQQQQAQAQNQTKMQTKITPEVKPTPAPTQKPKATPAPMKPLPSKGGQSQGKPIAVAEPKKMNQTDPRRSHEMSESLPPPEQPRSDRRESRQPPGETNQRSTQNNMSQADRDLATEAGAWGIRGILNRNTVDSHLDVYFRKAEMPNELRVYKQLILSAMRHELNTNPNSMSESAKMEFSHVCELFSSVGISRLEKKVPRYPKAKYFCQSCNYHLDSLKICIQHIVDERHVKGRMTMVEDVLCASLSDFPEGRESTFSEMVMKTFIQHGITEKDQLLRMRLMSRLRKNFKAYPKFEEFELELFGSSSSGFGFASSDVNVNVTLPASYMPGDPERNVSAFRELALLLTEKISFTKAVKETGNSKWLTLSFEDIHTGKICTIHVNNAAGVNCAELFAEYDKFDERVRPLVVAFRYWAHIANIDNPEEGTLPGFYFTILALHYLQEMKVVPILHDVARPGMNTTEFAVFYTAEQAWKKFKFQSSNLGLGRLFAGLIQYYASFASTDKVVTISRPAPSRKSDKAWNRKLSIEDPVLPGTNLARCLSSNKVCDYIFERLKVAHIYFGTPRHRGGPLFDGILSASNVTPSSEVYYFTKAGLVAENPLQDVIRQMQASSLGQRHPQQQQQQQQSVPSGVSQGLLPRDPTRARMVTVTDKNGSKRAFVIKEDVHLIANVLTEKEYFYEFDQTILRGTEDPPKYCKACSMDGHLKKDCPEETLPRMSRVNHEPTPFTLRVLNSVMHKNFELEALNDNDVTIRMKITNEIRAALSPVFEDFDLTMFGSTYNGFGLHFSDVDICLRLNSLNMTKAQMQMQSEEVNAILKTVVSQLKSAGCMQEILAIPSAKVPIVKFRHRMSKLEGDISLSNMLALHNTKMLRLYADIDDRLKILGCFLKRLTKLCDISDASKGSLSSYGYVLMIIHFLQQHTPPVLPVLQELPVGTRPEKIIEGCNAWFFSDIKNLNAVWSGFGKNKESVSELWTAMLKFYAENFQFDDQVITINQLAPLSRVAKSWTSDTVIAIEDPFERSHNLGAGLSRRMGVHIVKTFQRFREIFTNPLDGMTNVDFSLYYLDPRRIRGNNNPPVDRQCRVCNRIGHFARNCTFSATGDERTYAYRDEEAPSHPKRHLANVGKAAPFPAKTGFATRIVQNQNQQRRLDSHPGFTTNAHSRIEKKPLIQPESQSHLAQQNMNTARQSNSNSNVMNANVMGMVRPTRNEQQQQHSMNVYGGTSSGSTTSGVGTGGTQMRRIAGASPAIAMNSRSHVLPHQVVQPFQNNFLHQSPTPEIQFFGGDESQDSTSEVMEEMISRNPGVVFELGPEQEKMLSSAQNGNINGNCRAEKANENQNAVQVQPVAAAAAAPAATFNAIGPITPPQEYRTTPIENDGKVVPPMPPTGGENIVNAPPPGFLVYPKPQVAAVSAFDMDKTSEYSIYGNLMPQQQQDQDEMLPFGEGKTSSGTSDLGTVGLGNGRHNAPPPGFSSLPPGSGYSLPIQQQGFPMMGNHFQGVGVGNMYQHHQQQSQQQQRPQSPPDPMNVFSVFRQQQQQNVSGSSYGEDTSGSSNDSPQPMHPQRNLNYLRNISATDEDILMRAVTTASAIGAAVPPSTYYHSYMQAQSQTQMNMMYPLNGLPPGSAGAVSPFHQRYEIDISNYTPVNKSPMMVMRPGVPGEGMPMSNQGKNDMVGATGSYLLSHVHHGPVVSAVPVQTGYSQHQMVQHQQQQQQSQHNYPYRYGYPYQHVQMSPAHYHQQMMAQQQQQPSGAISGQYGTQRQFSPLEDMMNESDHGQENVGMRRSFDEIPGQRGGAMGMGLPLPRPRSAVNTAESGLVSVAAATALLQSLESQDLI